MVDGIRARFELIGRTHVETFYYTCGLGATCAGTRVYAANDELMVVSVFGRAFSTQVLQPGEQPLIPQTETPPPELARALTRARLPPPPAPSSTERM